MPQIKKFKKYFDPLVLLFVSLLTHYKHTFNSDEGAVLSGAWRLLQGQTMYQDFFEMAPPGSFYAVKWLWEIFGAEYMPVKIFFVAVLFSSAYGLYLLGRELSGKNFLFPSALFIFSSAIWPIISYHTLSAVTLIWGTYFFIRYRESARPLFLYCAGAITALSFLVLHNRALILFGLISIFLIIDLMKKGFVNARKDLLLFFGLSFLPVLILFKWDFALLYESLVVWPTENYSHLAKGDADYWVYLMVFSLFILSARKNQKAIFTALLGFLLFLSSRYGTDLLHLSFIAWPMFALLSLLPDYFLDFKENKKSWLILPCLIFLFYNLSSVSVGMLTHFPPFSSIKGHEFFSYLEEECPGEYLYAGPFWPNLYYEARRLNPTSFDWLITNHHTPAQFAQSARELENKKPQCVVWGRANVEKYGYDRSNAVEAFIAENYYHTDEKYGFFIYKAR